MIKKELSKKSENDIKEAFDFWGLKYEKKIDDLTKLINQSSYFALQCNKLLKRERSFLYVLFMEGGVCIKGEMIKDFVDVRDFNTTMDSLTHKAFIYLRKNRRLLNDTLDKIYLFPEVKRVLLKYKRFTNRDIKEHLDKLLPPLYTFNENCNDQLKKIFSYGGFLIVGENDYSECYSLFEEGLIEPALLIKDRIFNPIWVITENAIKTLGVQQVNGIPYRQSLYLNKMMNVIDCLSFKKLNKKTIQKSITNCIQKICGNLEDKERFIKDLISLRILNEEMGTITVQDYFSNIDFQKKISLLEKIFSKEEKEIISCVKKKKVCSKSSLLSCPIRDYILNRVFQKNFQEQNIEEVYERYVSALNTLIFRGFLVESFKGDIVKENPIDQCTPKKNSLIFNTDREILIFSESISLFPLYILAGFSDILHSGEIIRLRLDRNSIARGTKYIGDVEIFTNFLKIASKGEISNNQIKTIEEWADSVLTVNVELSLCLKIDTEEARLRLYHNKYIRTHIDKECGNILLLRKNIDSQRLKQELRKENIFTRFKE